MRIPLRKVDPENERYRAIAVGRPAGKGKSVVPEELYPCLVVHVTDQIWIRR